MITETDNKGCLNELALFAGAGGGILGGKLLGWQTICAVEINAFCARRLMQRQNERHLPPFPIWDDVCTFDGHPWRRIVDVVSGGFPCQDISICGNGGGIAGEKSGLWGEMARIICEIRPEYVFVENSPLLTSRGLDRVLGDLASMGYNARWGVFSACSIGASHTRERLFVVADSYGQGKTNPGRWQRQEAISEIRKKPLPDHWGSIEFSRENLHQAVHNRKNDVLACGVDRREAIGNGQVPGVVKLAWDTLINR